MRDEIDDRFAEQLAVLDEQVASGDIVAAETLIEEPELSSRLESALDCLQLLEQVWPRETKTALPTMPRVFGRYHTVRELGRGGFGIVFLAEDLQLARDVAIKVQRPEAVLSPESRKRFLREARSSAPLKHPSLVTVYDSGEEGLWCWIASEVVHGPALNHYLAGLREPTAVDDAVSLQPLASSLKPQASSLKLPAVRDAVQLVRELAEGVAHAHTQGVLHRDIKPANILLEPRCDSPESLADYRGKLTDFGLARSLDAEPGETRTGARLGTPQYMAPEQVEGRKEQIGPATDVYGLGGLLYELLTGKPPFTGESESDTLKQVLLDEPPGLRKARPEISRDLEVVVFKALEKNPARRYANARALADDLGRVLANEPTAARPITALHRGFRWARRHPAVCIASVACALTSGLLAIVAQQSQENYRLLGLRKIVLNTEPTGARVVFAPLDPQSGEPQAGGAIRPNERTPITQQLAPGDYLVVVALDDGRFHEVYRHVPKPGEIPEIYNHHLSRALDTGLLELPTIRIPDQIVANGMALIGGRQGAAGEQRAAHESFLLDCRELKFSERTSPFFGEVSANGTAEGADYAAIMSHDRAMAMAEKLGKRLPTSREYEIARSYCRPAVRDLSGNQTGAKGFGVVGIPQDDVTDTHPPVVGLRSNVAEWTVSSPIVLGVRGKQAQLVSADDTSYPVHLADPRFTDYRVARGGNHNVANGVNMLRDAIFDQDEIVPALRHGPKPGVGVRFARSARPRFIDLPGN